MHYSSLLRVTRRERGIRIYAAHDHAPAPTGRAEIDARLDALVDVAVNVYAPLTAAGLVSVVRQLRYAAPQWRRGLPGALTRAKNRLPHARVGGIDWYWAAAERLSGVYA